MKEERNGEKEGREGKEEKRELRDGCQGAES